MTVAQNCINVLLPIDTDKYAAVESAISATSLQDELADVDTLHFLSLALLPQNESGDTNFWLLIEANFDGDNDTFLNQLWDIAHTQLVAILSAAKTYNLEDKSAFVELLTAYDQGHGTNHVALPGMDLTSIRGSVKVFKEAQKAKLLHRSGSLSAKALCDAIAQDKSVKRALLNLPEKWPEDALKQWHPVIAMSISALLSFIFLIATGDSPFQQGDATISKALIFCAIFFIVPPILLFGKSKSTSHSIPKIPLSKIFRIASATLVALLCLMALNALGSWMLPFYLLAFNLLLLLIILVVFKFVPATSPIEYFLSKLSIIAFLFPVGIFLVSIGVEGSIGIAAQTWLVGAVILLLLGLSQAPPIPLELIDKHGIAIGAAIYFLLPFSIPILIQGLAIAFTIIVISLVLALLYAQCRLQQQENFDYEAPPVWVEDARRTAIASFEAKHCNRQNHLISITHVKPGRLRWFSMRIVLLFVGFARLLQGTRGELSGIVTIHFARWILVGEKESQLLFISNYGGNWGSYLDEFIDHASEGLTSIWSNTIGFPRSAWLRSGGAANAQRFKMFARRSQWPTLFYYSAYPELTVDQIEKYVRLNTLLAKPKRNKEEYEEVLRLL